MRKIEYARDAIKSLQRMDRITASRIEGKIIQYAQKPSSLSNNVKALKGQVRLKRLRVGDWRVIFTEDLVVLMIVKIAARGSVYD